MSIANRFGMALLLIVGLGGTAQAVSLGKIEVASHLGEPFYAEVPLTLQEDESINSVFVELASPAEYRILEIYRDPVLNAIHSDIESDARGPRVKLTSDGAIDVPFFNLVLKLRYGRATHFKKFPIFLDQPPITLTSAKPERAAAKQTTAMVAKGEAGKKAGFTPYSGWARTSRYGPMVYGDTLVTVARRLRVDKRYTLPQVLVALFEKNRSKFDKDNMNLIKAGTYLDVPTAAEVEAHSPAEASRIVSEHERRWSILKQQPKYAAIAEAQKHRYSKRVRLAKTAASEVRKKPPPPTKAAPSPAAGAGEAETGAAAGTKGEGVAKQPANETTDGGEAAALSALKEENALLKQRLQQAEDKIAALMSKNSEAELEAAAQRIKRLELSLARLQTELDQARQQSVEPAAMQSWTNYGLMGAVVLLLLVVAYLLRRERAHPAAETTEATAEPTAEQAVAVPATESSAAAAEGGKKEAAAEPEHAEEELVSKLFEEDTGGIQAIDEGAEEPDPNVDYLAEADVYLRYGMEDEALRHVRLAVRQRPDNADAHAKLVHLLQSRGDQEDAEKAIAAARAALSGDALARFEDLIAGESGAPSAAEGGAEPEVTVGAEEAEVAEEKEGLELGDVIKEAEAEIEGVGGEAATEAVDFSDIDWDVEGPIAEAVDEKAAGTEEAGAQEKGVAAESMDVSGIELELPQAEAEEKTAGEAPKKEEVLAAEEEGLDFDLADLELPQPEGAMNKTSESSGKEAAAAEKEKEGLDFDLAGMEPFQEKKAPTPTADMAEEGATGAEEVAPKAEGAHDLELDLVSEGEATAKGRKALEELPKVELAKLQTEQEPGGEQALSEAQAIGSKQEEGVGEIDLSQEMDALLSEMDFEGDDEELSPTTLAIDTGKSLLAEGQLDEAQRAFSEVLDSKMRGQALLGLAEIALQRGDKERARQMLAEAEAILDASNQEWFDRLQGQLQP